MGKRVGDWYQYSGAVHVHTTESDGTRPFDEVVALGQEVGLDFIMFCDHMNLNHRERGNEGIYDSLLAVVGYEHNDSNDIHHFLVFDSPEVYPRKMSAAEYVSAAVGDGAIGILAHPDEVRDRLKAFPPYPWKDWSVEGFTGLEIWNQMSEWMERLTRFNMLAMAFSPRKSMVAPTDRILRKWDELSRSRKVVGLAGVDAHAFRHKVGPFKVTIFPYKVHFRCLRTHILLPKPMATEFSVARDQLYDALRDCRVFFSNMRWGAADDFELVADNGTDRVVCGGTLPMTGKTFLRANLPGMATLKLIADGEKIFEIKSDNLEYEVKRSGLYRLEAWKGRRGWIFSNHIRIVS